MHMLFLFLFFLLTLVGPLRAVEAKAEVTDAYIKENLDKIPAHDPAASNVPPLRAEIRGQHPRLLFTAAEAATIKKTADADPLLKPVYAANANWAKHFSLGKESTPSQVLKDGPAIVSAQTIPAAALAYAMDHDPAVKQAITNALTVMLSQDHWAKTKELDSSMGAACNMLVVGMLYDAVRDDLEPEFRVQLAAKMLVQARRLHWLGYQSLCSMPIKYWQQDPQPNHRWYRAAGMAACLLPIADEPGLETGYLLEQFKQEMDFLIKWFPKEGDCHEGALYQVFGLGYLAMAASMMDRSLGTNYLQAPGFRTAWQQQLYYWAPGRMGDMSFGDDQNNEGQFGQDGTYFFLGPRLSRDQNAQAALLRHMEKSGQPYLTKFCPKETRPFVPPWGMLLFYDPTVARGDYKAIPPSHLFADLGAASMRDSWEDDAVALAFKCGPTGGYRLNEYAWEYKNEKGAPHYVNVAHDDPDANTFSISMAGEHIFHPGVYSLDKMTRQASCITIDGKGQVTEGSECTQPVPGTNDMRKLSYLTGWKQDANGRIIVEGEASAAYRGIDYNGSRASPNLPNPVLKHFRRTAVWLPGEYILLLDDIVANGKHAIAWCGTVEKAQIEKPEEGRCYASSKNGKRVEFQLLADHSCSNAVQDMLLDGQWGKVPQQQFQFTADTEAVKFACLIDPWGKKPTLTLRTEAGFVILRVHAESFDDTWTWRSAPDTTTPSAIEGKRNGAALIALSAKDTAPQGD